MFDIYRPVLGKSLIHFVNFPETRTSKHCYSPNVKTNECGNENYKFKI